MVSVFIPGSSSRLADVYLPHWKRCQRAALDKTVISALQSQILIGAAHTPGYALQEGEERKMSAHAEACRSAGVLFIPLVAKFLGCWSEEVINTIKSIGRLQVQRLYIGIPPSKSICHLLQRLVVSLWRGNAALWIHSKSTSTAAVDSKFKLFKNLHSVPHMLWGFSFVSFVVMCLLATCIRYPSITHRKC